MSREFNKYAKELSKKIANIPTGKYHKMPKKAKAYNGEHLEETLSLLEKKIGALDYKTMQNVNHARLLSLGFYN